MYSVVMVHRDGSGSLGQTCLVPGTHQLPPELKCFQKAFTRGIQGLEQDQNTLLPSQQLSAQHQLLGSQSGVGQFVPLHDSQRWAAGAVGEAQPWI